LKFKILFHLKNSSAVTETKKRCVKMHQRNAHSPKLGNVLTKSVYLKFPWN